MARAGTASSFAFFAVNAIIFSRVDAAEESLRMDALRGVVDTAELKLKHGVQTRGEALEYIEYTKLRILAIFPDAEQKFELIIRPRFMRVVEEFINEES